MVILDFLPKIVFPPFSAAILNFYIKCKNILEMVHDRAISNRFFTCWVYTESCGTFKEAFSCIIFLQAS